MRIEIQTIRITCPFHGPNEICLACYRVVKDGKLVDWRRK